MNKQILIVISEEQFTELSTKLDKILSLLQQTNQGQPGNNYLTQAQAEEATGLSRGTLLKWRKKGVLRAIKPTGGKLFYNAEDVKKLAGANGTGSI